MLSKSRLKFIRSLRLSKFRASEGLFIAEGDKLIKEAIDPSSNTRLKVHSLYCLPEWLNDNKGITGLDQDTVFQINPKELSQISNLKTPNQVLALVNLPAENQPEIDFGKRLVVALDNIQDPGNAGTIIRLADWFGYQDIILSAGCADPYSPKVVQASMGSIFRIRIHNLPIKSIIQMLPPGIPVYGAVMNGRNIYTSDLKAGKGLIIFGNESQGISSEIKEFITHPLTIPRGAKAGPGPESLNVSVAVGIILSEFSRQSS